MLAVAIYVNFFAHQYLPEMVNFSKMESWYLLLYVSFTTVTLVFRDALSRDAEVTPDRASATAPPAE